MKRLLDYDPLTGVYTYHDYDHETKTTYLETVQDAQPYIEVNKKLYNDENYKKAGIKAEWYHVARIPIGVQEKWLKMGVNIYNKDHMQKVKKLLMDPEYRYLRTASGRI